MTHPKFTGRIDFRVDKAVETLFYTTCPEGMQKGFFLGQVITAGIAALRQGTTIPLPPGSLDHAPELRQAIEFFKSCFGTEFGKAFKAHARATSITDAIDVLEQSLPEAD